MVLRRKLRQRSNLESEPKDAPQLPDIPTVKPYDSKEAFYADAEAVVKYAHHQDRETGWLPDDDDLLLEIIEAGRKFTNRALASEPLKHLLVEKERSMTVVEAKVLFQVALMQYYQKCGLPPREAFMAVHHQCNNITGRDPEDAYQYALAAGDFPDNVIN